MSRSTQLSREEAERLVDPDILRHATNSVAGKTTGVIAIDERAKIILWLDPSTTDGYLMKGPAGRRYDKLVKLAKNISVSVS